MTLPLAILDHSHQWGLSDLWQTEALWNVPSDLPQWPIAVLVIGGVVLSVIYDRRKRAKKKGKK